MSEVLSAPASDAVSSRRALQDTIAVDDLSPRGTEFLSYWMRARGGKSMPSPDDIDPSAFVALLPYMRYLRWSGPDKVVYRVWGTMLTEWMKTDLTGRNVFDLLPEQERPAEHARVRALHNMPCGFVQHREVTDTRGLVHVFEFLTLPVSAGSDGESRMIGTGAMCDEDAAERFELDTAPRTVIKRVGYLDLGFGVPKHVTAQVTRG